MHLEALEAVAKICARREDWTSAKTAALRLQFLVPHSTFAKQVIARAEDHQPAPQFGDDATGAYRAGGAVDKVPGTWTG